MRRESQLEAELEQAEEVYEGLIQTRGSLGTMLAETIRKGKNLEEFKRHLRDLPLLIQQADLRRTELRHELLDRRAKQAEDEYRRAAEEAQRATRSHEQARKAHLKGQGAARRSGLEARRLAGARDKEAEHLQELLRVPEDAQVTKGITHDKNKVGNQRRYAKGGVERKRDGNKAKNGYKTRDKPTTGTCEPLRERTLPARTPTVGALM
jgi:hypothetical protein